MAENSLIPAERIEKAIYVLRGQRVLLDEDLAELYGVTTKRLNEQVKRNRVRFPSHFMFQLTMQEFTNLRSQIATSRWGGRRTLPYAFTEHGTVMLANESPLPTRADQVSDRAGCRRFHRIVVAPTVRLFRY